MRYAYVMATEAVMDTESVPDTVRRDVRSLTDELLLCTNPTKLLQRFRDSCRRSRTSNVSFASLLSEQARDQIDDLAWKAIDGSKHSRTRGFLRRLLRMDGWSVRPDRLVSELGPESITSRRYVESLLGLAELTEADAGIEEIKKQRERRQRPTSPGSRIHGASATADASPSDVQQAIKARKVSVTQRPRRSRITRIAVHPQSPNRPSLTTNSASTSGIASPVRDTELSVDSTGFYSMSPEVGRAAGLELTHDMRTDSSDDDGGYVQSDASSVPQSQRATPHRIVSHATAQGPSRLMSFADFDRLSRASVPSEFQFSLHVQDADVPDAATPQAVMANLDCRDDRQHSRHGRLGIFGPCDQHYESPPHASIMPVVLDSEQQTSDFHRAKRQRISGHAEQCPTPRPCDTNSSRPIYNAAPPHDRAKASHEDSALITMAFEPNDMDLEQSNDILEHDGAPVEKSKPHPATHAQPATEGANAASPANKTKAMPPSPELLTSQILYQQPHLAR
ncbi:hypothetical protein BAUCODRAFT_331674 [Baudoinia panamericana UAMH 10762]|uniref:Uncharacterized protein n=1 Tax=Baudoinia panamericana (strain UAMH 10762) TaxID=717646 RepID=M2MXD9_BAUPA|nr:uncharacterized protein BAUCODRAFT_331674 [Baudoinia panamericana UAMH 10762]EMC90920.1 hypothetical protein BAUCODRAFT_331674 [Baudoinia panamericana UAMH 10762]